MLTMAALVYGYLLAAVLTYRLARQLLVSDDSWAFRFTAALWSVACLYMLPILAVCWLYERGVPRGRYADVSSYPTGFRYPKIDNPHLICGYSADPYCRHTSPPQLAGWKVRKP